MHLMIKNKTCKYNHTNLNNTELNSNYHSKKTTLAKFYAIKHSYIHKSVVTPKIYKQNPFKHQIIVEKNCRWSTDIKHLHYR